MCEGIMAAPKWSLHPKRLLQCFVLSVTDLDHVAEQFLSSHVAERQRVSKRVGVATKCSEASVRACTAFLAARLTQMGRPPSFIYASMSSLAHQDAAYASRCPPPPIKYTYHAPCQRNASIAPTKRGQKRQRKHLPLDQRPSKVLCRLRNSLHRRNFLLRETIHLTSGRSMRSNGDHATFSSCETSIRSPVRALRCLVTDPSESINMRQTGASAAQCDTRSWSHTFKVSGFVACVSNGCSGCHDCETDILLSLSSVFRLGANQEQCPHRRSVLSC